MNMPIHVIHLWPESIKQSIWPCDISLALDIRNKYKLNKKGATPFENLNGLL